MTTGDQRLWVVAYDVRDKRRLQRVHRAVKAQAMALQYSVFLFEGTRDGLNALLMELQSLMDARQDDLRAYPVPRRVVLHWLGRGALPEGALLLSRFIQGPVAGCLNVHLDDDQT